MFSLATDEPARLSPAPGLLQFNQMWTFSARWHPPPQHSLANAGGWATVWRIQTPPKVNLLTNFDPTGGCSLDLDSEGSSKKGIKEGRKDRGKKEKRKKRERRRNVYRDPFRSPIWIVNVYQPNQRQYLRWQPSFANLLRKRRSIHLLKTEENYLKPAENAQTKAIPIPQFLVENRDFWRGWISKWLVLFIESWTPLDKLP